MFSGHHEHSLDSQGRVAIPAGFRLELSGDGTRPFMLTENYDAGSRCLLAYPMTEWQLLAGQFAGRSPFDEDLIRLRRLVFGGAFECTLDKQGRVLVPPEMRVYAGVAKELIWVGAGGYLELWDRNRWREERARLRESAGAILGRLSSTNGGGTNAAGAGLPGAGR